MVGTCLRKYGSHLVMKYMGYEVEVAKERTEENLGGIGRE